MEFQVHPKNQKMLARMQEDGITIENIYGSCPVQGEGEIAHESGKRVAFYFRARGNRWSMEIGRKGREMANDAWRYEEAWPGEKFDAGYIETHEALALIERAIGFWKKDGAPVNRGLSQQKTLAELEQGYRGIKSLGFAKWLSEVGYETASLFKGLHRYGTQREERISDKIDREMQKYETTMSKKRRLILVDKDRAFTDWLCEGSQESIANILEMQK